MNARKEPKDPQPVILKDINHAIDVLNQARRTAKVRMTITTTPEISKAAFSKALKFAKQGYRTTYSGVVAVTLIEAGCKAMFVPKGMSYGYFCVPTDKYDALASAAALMGLSLRHWKNADKDFRMGSINRPSKDGDVRNLAPFFHELMNDPVQNAKYVDALMEHMSGEPTTYIL